MKSSTIALAAALMLTAGCRRSASDNVSLRDESGITEGEDYLLVELPEVGEGVIISGCLDETDNTWNRLTVECEQRQSEGEFLYEMFVVVNNSRHTKHFDIWGRSPYDTNICDTDVYDTMLFGFSDAGGDIIRCIAGDKEGPAQYPALYDIRLGPGEFIAFTATAYLESMHGNYQFLLEVTS